MLALTKENIRTITETIDKAEINFSHLREDLIDHVCCEIEHELANGIDFSLAFEKIKNKVGIAKLHDVQEKTVLNVDKNYCLMKNIMKISGMVSTFLLMVGSLFKINHWPGGSMVLFVGFILLSFLFLPSACYVMNKTNKENGRVILFLTAFLGSFGFVLGLLFKIMHWPGAPVLLIVGIGIMCLAFFPSLLFYLIRISKTKQEKTIYIIAVMSAIIYLTGFLCKINHWPGGTMLLTLGSVILIVIFIPAYSILKYKKEKHVKPAFIYIVVSFSWFFMFSMLISLSISSEVGSGFNLLNTENKNLYKYYSEKNATFYSETTESDQYLDYQKLRTEVNETIDYIENIKSRIMDRLNYESGGGDVNTIMIENWNNTEIPSSILIGNEENPSTVALDLKQKLENLRGSFDMYTVGNSDLTLLINQLINTSVPQGSPWFNKWDRLANTWVNLYFDRVNISGCMYILTCYQKNIRIAEYKTLQYLATKSSSKNSKTIAESENIGR